ncbi:MAG: fumarate/nitrate reduction transcriptional regulator Fnr [Pseudomonadota bacterium]
MNNSPKAVKLQSVTSACQLCHARELCMASCLNENELERFDNIVGHRSPMERGERLFMAGEKIKSIYVLHSGSVKTYIESVNGDNQITGFHFPGDVIGIHGVENKVHTDTVEALETSSVCELRFDNLEAIVETFPSLQQELMRYVFREMNHEQEQLMVLGKLTADRRLAHFLLDISSRLKDHGLSESKFNLMMTRNDIANYLGLAIETVSRVLTRFQKQEIIEVDRRSVHIRDFSRLRAVYQDADLATDNTSCSA